MPLENPLWHYVLELYSRPGVEQACLGLQQNGLSINRLLFCCWLADESRLLRPEQLADSEADRWQRELTAPLRSLRYRVREQKDGAPELEALYRAMRQAELAAEQVELARLFDLGSCWPADPATARGDLLLRNIGLYLTHSGVEASDILRCNLEILLCADQPALDRAALRALRW
ncbi:MAG: TIGR02444 family protein [Oceanospirillaceae bacterium]|nr:TIGR02444 family protein [Oceanospirillaceae bacterium]